MSYAEDNRPLPPAECQRIGYGPDGWRYPVVTVCGSMRYWSEMLKVAENLTAAGQIVLMPYVADYIGGKTADATKVMLDDMHRAKINMSGSIVVVGTHIGESTRGEIEYARLTDKPVRYWAPQGLGVSDDRD